MTLNFTPEQEQEVVNAFSKIHGPPAAIVPGGPIATPEQWAKSRVVNYIREIVKSYRAQVTYDSVKTQTEIAVGQVESEYKLQ